MSLLRSTAGVSSVIALIAGCFGGENPQTPAGAPCLDTFHCAVGMYCEYGRCRQLCVVDADCHEGTSCVASLDISERVCMLSFEQGCATGEGCPERLYCGPDDLCREGCEGPSSCEGNRECHGAEYVAGEWVCPGRDCVCIER